MKDWRVVNLLKGDSNKSVFLWNLQNFKRQTEYQKYQKRNIKKFNQNDTNGEKFRKIHILISTKKMYPDAQKLQSQSHMKFWKKLR